MDHVPYEFVDRVFTKLAISDVKNVHLESPIWKEVTRVYTLKLHTINVHISWFYEDGDDDKCKIRYRIADSSDGKTLTLDEALKLDSRFYRLDDLSIYGANDDDGMTTIAIEEVPRLLNFASHFGPNCLNFPFRADGPPVFLKMLIESELRPSSLSVAHFLGENDFIRKHLRSEHLQQFIIQGRSTWSSSFYRDVEAFVCQPNFEDLQYAAGECFDDAALKRILAYWRTTAKPTKRWSFNVRTSHDMSDQFALLMPASGKKSSFYNSFKERIGDFELTANYGRRSSRFHRSRLYKFDYCAIHNFDVESPNWKEVADVYKQELHTIFVDISWSNDYGSGIRYEIDDIERSTKYTLDEALKLDSRFYRAGDLTISCRDDDRMLDIDIEQVPRVLDYASHFMADLTLRSKVPSVLLETLIESALHLSSLSVAHFVGEEDIIRKYLRSADLRRFSVLGTANWSSSFYRAVETFVCQPNFEHLQLAEDGLGEAAFKRILTYWRTAKPTKE